MSTAAAPSITEWALKPALLVGLTTKLVGGAELHRTDRERDESEDGRLLEQWTTQRIVENAEEYRQGQLVRSACRNAVTKVCIQSPFGVLMCPLSKKAELDAALAEAARLRDEFNATAQHSRIQVLWVCGRIASTDAEAIAQIRSELLNLLRGIEIAARGGAYKSMREMATKAQQLNQLLDGSGLPNALKEAIKAARKSARTLSREVNKKGNDLKTVLSTKCDMTPIMRARLALTAAREPAAGAAPTDSPLPGVEQVPAPAASARLVGNRLGIIRLRRGTINNTTNSKEN